MDVASDGAAPEPDDQRPAPTRGVWEKLADRSHDYAHDRVIRCGWGRILFAQTFDGPERLVEELRREAEGQRDIAFYVHEPHVLVGHAPQEVFLDPSHTYRADLTGTLPEMPQVHGVRIDVARGRSDLLAVDAILRRRGMVPIVVDELLRGEDADSVTWFLARRERDFEPVGSVMGVDHALAFDDPEHGASLWCLAVGRQAPHAGLGESLVRPAGRTLQGAGLRLCRPLGAA
jgi:ribosomal protein S18 acetylase RimI-like enzyme